MSYEGVDGTVRDPGFQLSDDSYDGGKGPGLLRQGMGQLYDGELGRPLNQLQLQAYGRGKGESWGDGEWGVMGKMFGNGV